jgi:undecaprenyl diphosphate synthase
MIKSINLIFIICLKKMFLSKIFEKVSSSILKLAYIPKSIAVIMDGNRRYAQSLKKDKLKGHEDGLDTLMNVCTWCISLGIRDLTAYAFSIDNFNRCDEEITHIMNLIRTKFKKMSENEGLLIKNGIKVVLIGKLEYFEKDIVEIFNEVENKTKDCTK